MPPADRHRAISAAIPNPFDKGPTRINEYTAVEIATLQARLNKQLGPEFISTRAGPGGGKVAYVAAEKVINLANEVFGFNGWSSSIQNVQIDFVDESQSTGKISLGLSVIVRVTLKDGTYHEDVGYGSIENARGKAAAFEKAKKEAATDALKRALRTFGNLLGNCLYDKDYLGKVGKLKVVPVKWDVERLHRHPDYAPKPKPEPEKTVAPSNEGLVRARTNGSGMSGDFEDEFGGSLFDGMDITEAHGDEVSLNSVTEGESFAEPSKSVKAEPAQKQLQRMQSVPVLPQAPPPPAGPSHTSNQQAAQDPYKLQRELAMAKRLQATESTGARIEAPSRPPNNTSAPSKQRGSATKTDSSSDPRSVDAQEPLNGRSTPEQIPTTITNPNPNPNPNLPVTFVSSRAAEMVQQTVTDISNTAVFNPHAESPSLRRTSGVDHRRSGPISRQAVTNQAVAVNGGNVQPNQPSPQQQNAQQHPNQGPRPNNYVDPRADTNRRIGMPGVAQSPLANRGAYKPPGPAHGIKRPPLADLSNLAGEAGDLSHGLEAKKAKVAGI